MTTIPYIDGMHAIINRYDGFILDIFGVIHDGLRVFPGTVACLEQLKNAQKSVCLLSNSPRRAASAIQHCQSLGISRTLFDGVVTSGEATHHALQSHAQTYGQRCYFIGGPFVRHLVEGIDLELVTSTHEADFILNAIPGTEDHEVADLTHQLDIGLKRNLPMICANPDMVVNIGNEQKKCAGAYAQSYEQQGGTVTYYGKPYAPVYDEALAVLGLPDKKRLCAVGDSLHTDIQGAVDYGIDSVFNLTGIHWQEVRLDHSPGKADIEKIRHIIDSQPHRPTYTMGGFDW